jgi:hypothetical protein
LVLFWLSEPALAMNPGVFADPQVIPQLVRPRGRGRPTIYSQELIEEFCGLIVDGLTLEKASRRIGMPGRRTLYDWMERYPEFRARYERAVEFRNQCWMDDTVDIADDTKSDVKITFTDNGTPVAQMVPELTAQRRLKIDARWKQINGALRYKASKQQQLGDDAKVIEGKIVEHDPVHGQLYQWEIEYQRRLLGRTNGPGRSPDGSRNGPNGQGA